MSFSREVASYCEAKLHGFRRTNDGVVVSFVLHPAEVPAALALDPLGTRYMLAIAQIGDDEQPIPPRKSQARADAASRHYAGVNDGEKATIRAAALPRDWRFRNWLEYQSGQTYDEEGAAEFIRTHCCDGNSRSLIASTLRYRERFEQLEAQFMEDSGLRPEVR